MHAVSASVYIHYVLLSFCSSGPTEDRILSPGWYVCNWKREGGRRKYLEAVEKWEGEKDKGPTKSFSVL